MFIPKANLFIPAKIEWVEKTAQKVDLFPSKFFKEFKVENEKLGDLFVNVRKYDDGAYRYIIEVQNRLKKILGFDLFSLDPQNKNMFEFNIEIPHDYRNKKIRLGELLKLSSIMEMIENKAPQIEIYSKDTAIFFHSKFKFEPAIYEFKQRDDVLLIIAKDKSPIFADLVAEAKALYKKCDTTRKDGVTQGGLCGPANNLIKRYIERALLEPVPEKKHPFDWGMRMILKRESVLENKDLFNNKYINQGIDYKI